MTITSFAAIAAVAVAAAGAAAASARKSSGLLFAERGGDCEDDSDIKIAGAEKAKPDELGEAKELEEHKRSGNLIKARKLGAELAACVLDEDGDPSFGKDISEDGEMMRQRRQLLTFTVGCAVSRAIESRVLAQIVTDEFYRVLEAGKPECFRDINRSGSFSFYYLSVGRGEAGTGAVGRGEAGTGAVSRGEAGTDAVGRGEAEGGEADGGTEESRVGRSFAMLAGREGDRVTQELGEALYLHFSDIVSAAVKSAGLSGSTAHK